MQYQNDDHRLICALSPDLTLTQIGKKFGITASEVKVICEMYGVETRAKGLIPGSTAGKIKPLLIAGMDNHQIAKQTNIPIEYVRKIRSEMKMPLGRKLRLTDEIKKIVARVNRLRSDGMTAKDACAAVMVPQATYQRYKKALG